MEGLNAPERHSAVALLELHLLLERELHRLGAHVKHRVHFCVGAVVLQATSAMSATMDKMVKLGHALPKAKLCRGLPKPVNLSLVVRRDALVVDYKQRDSRDVIGKRRDDRYWHVVCAFQAEKRLRCAWSADCLLDTSPAQSVRSLYTTLARSSLICA